MPLQTLACCLSALCILTPTCLAEDKSNEKDKSHGAVQTKLQGRWEIVAGVNQGRELMATELAGIFVTISGNSVTTYDRDQQAKYRAVFQIDETKQPIQITMRPVVPAGPLNASGESTTPTIEDASANGILKFDGPRTWLLCYALPGADRPTKFESKKGSKVLLFTLEESLGDPVPQEGQQGDPIPGTSEK